MPFRGTAAVAAGRMTLSQLERDHTRVYRDVYMGSDVAMTARMRAIAAAEFAGPDAVLVGKSAAAMYFTKWIDPKDPAEVVRLARCRAPADLLYRRYALAPDEIRIGQGIKMTSPARTGFDIGRGLPRKDAIVRLDALCRATMLEPAEIAAVAVKHPRAPGLAHLRTLLTDVDGGADSPRETLTRLLLIDAGLPRPATQVVVTDSDGGFVARCDMGWREWRVVVEYDGSNHLDLSRHDADVERYAAIEDAGWSVVIVGAKLFSQRPHLLVDRVRTKLRDAGAPV